MEFQLDQGWTMRPVKGATGETYIGVKGEQQIFIKRNTTPMLAALSKEGITPKLVWTKRTGNGDVLTAQEWLDGRKLAPDEIGSRNDVIDVLYHLHHSESLRKMLQQIGGVTMTPELLWQELLQELPAAFEEHTFLRDVMAYLQKNLPTMAEKNITVVHGDVNHRNWLVCQHYLYLVDWDSVMFADYALDIGTILGQYVPLSKWSKWLVTYGVQATDETLERIHWYAVLSTAKEIKRLLLQGDQRRSKANILQLKRFFSG
ncbi:thiamine kinase-like enzyme [Enterococcus sp. PF1-24]|uniref:phosphotransferase family protein n=1 Tax=unclassified Enterococcus TaxID=2608891 RepID=UPI002476623C|nr:MULTISPECIES: phosphotransferase family protein [unclassified Enterococcus]MDH6365561.1 thiamine kinase-like enzyme [Enterococcus sp. PFB1-1]MDH6402649.1 thiamine kinase-like enzyme [Enterococcus sp. PF1-24]